MVDVDKTSEELIIERLAEELDTYADLDPHDTVRYRRPRAVLPEDCPLLCVWWDSKDIDFLTTKMFHWSFSVGISWQEATVEEAQTLMRDDTIARALIRNVKKIENRIEHLATNGWDIAPAWEITPGGVDYERMEEGLVEGYAMSVVISTTD